MGNGETWIATVNGISILHGNDQTFDNLRNVTGDHSSLPQNYTGSVVTVGSTIWVATYGGLAFTSATPGPSRYRSLGKASGRERVCPYVELTGDGVTIKKK